MRDFLKKEFLLGLGTGFIISAIILSLFGADLKTANQAKNPNEIVEAGGQHESKKNTQNNKITSKSESISNDKKTQGNEKDDDQAKANEATNSSINSPTNSPTDASKPKTTEQNQPLNNKVETEKYIEVVVKAGMGSEKISSLLETQGVIKNKDDFYKLVTARRAHSRFKVGTFKLPAGGNMEEILGILTGQKK